MTRAPFYRVLRFATSGLLQQAAIRSRAEALPGVDVLLLRSRALSMFEREDLWKPQFATRLVVEVSGSKDALGDERISGRFDPYRTFEALVAEVRPDLRELIEDLDAEHQEVTHGRIDFATREYELGILRGLAHSLVQQASSLKAKVDVAVEDHTLVGRVRGSVPAIKELAGFLLESPFVDRDDVQVSYAGSATPKPPSPG